MRGTTRGFTLMSLALLRMSKALLRMSKTLKGSGGFTLIELLVTLAIIGIAFGIVLTSSQALQRTTRDTQRQTDLRQIQGAIQQYYADQNYFPDNTFSIVSASLTDCSGNITPCAFSRTYLSKVPKDPLASQSYCYKGYISSNDKTSSGLCNNNVSSEKCQFYLLCTKLENTSSNADCLSSCGAEYNFGLNPQ